MHLPWSKKRAEDDSSHEIDSTRQAKARDHQEAEILESRTAYISKLVTELEDMRSRNHFAEKISLVYKGQA